MNKGEGSFSEPHLKEKMRIWKNLHSALERNVSFPEEKNDFLQQNEKFLSAFFFFLFPFEFYQKKKKKDTGSDNLILQKLSTSMLS